MLKAASALIGLVGWFTSDRIVVVFLTVSHAIILGVSRTISNVIYRLRGIQTVICCTELMFTRWDWSGRGGEDGLRGLLEPKLISVTETMIG